GLHGRVAEIEVAVLEPCLLADRFRRLIGQRERRGAGLVEQRQAGGPHLDLAGGQGGVGRLRAAAHHLAHNGNHVLGTQFAGAGVQGGILLLAENHLAQTGAVAQVQKQQGPQIAAAVYPGLQNDLAADVLRTQIAAIVGTVGGSGGLILHHGCSCGSGDESPVCPSVPSRRSKSTAGPGSGNRTATPARGSPTRASGWPESEPPVYW